MAGIVRINDKIMGIQEAAEKSNNICLASVNFSEAMHIFNLAYPFEDAIMSGSGCKGSIRGSSQKIAKAEAI